MPRPRNVPRPSRLMHACMHACGASLVRMRITVSLPWEIIDRLEALRAAQPFRPSLSAVVREVLIAALPAQASAPGAPTPVPSAGPSK